MMSGLFFAFFAGRFSVNRSVAASGFDVISSVALNNDIVLEVKEVATGEVANEARYSSSVEGQALFALAKIDQSVYLRVQESMSDVLMLAMVEQLAIEKPEQVSWFLAQCDSSQRGPLALAFVRTLSRQSPLKALAWVNDNKSTLSLGDYNAGLNEALGAYAKVDPSSAFGFLDRIENGEVRGNLALEVAKVWAVSDVDGGRKWLESLRECNVSLSVYYQCYSEILKGEIKRNPIEGLRELEALGSERLWSELLPAVVSGLSKDDMESALDLVAILDDSEAKKRAVLSLISTNAKIDTGTAMDLVVLNPGLFREDSESAREVFSQLSEFGLETVVLRFDQIPNGLKPAAAESVLLNLVKAGGDIDLATEWVEYLPKGEAFDRAVRVLARFSAESSPDEMFRWAERIGSSSMRAELLNSYIDYADAQALPEMARAFREANFSAEEKAAVFSKFDKRMTDELLTFSIR